MYIWMDTYILVRVCAVAVCVCSVDACTSSTMNLSVSVSEAVQSLVTSDIRQAALQFSWQPPPGTCMQS